MENLYELLNKRQQKEIDALRETLLKTKLGITELKNVVLQYAALELVARENASRAIKKLQDCAVDIKTSKAVHEEAIDLFSEYDSALKESNERFKEYLPLAVKAGFNVGRQSIGRQGANARHQTSNQARKFVTQEWQKIGKSNNQSKASFARSAVNLVLKKFDLKITEKTIREAWLRETPSAS